MLADKYRITTLMVPNYATLSISSKYGIEIGASTEGLLMEVRLPLSSALDQRTNIRIEHQHRSNQKIPQASK
jgi:hypothetical protein